MTIEFGVLGASIALGIVALWIFVVAIINVWPHLDREALKGLFWVKRDG